MTTTTTSVKPIPTGFHTVTPYLVTSEAGKVVDFLKRGLGAVEQSMLRLPEGKIGHTQLKIGDSLVMLTEACAEMPAQPVTFYLYVEDCDASWRQAVSAGGIKVSEPQDQFYGDRAGAVKDAGGNTWWVATHREEVDDQEIARRMQAKLATAKQGAGPKQQKKQ
jgi:PhnB protein